MEITNLYGIPEPDYKWLISSEYDKSPDGVPSITTLISPPRARLLAERHDAEITIDASELVKLKLGEAVHDSVYRRTNPMEGWIQEVRREFKIPGTDIVVRGKPDMIQLPDILWDRKVTSVWSAIFGEKEEWSWQTNGYRLMLAENRHLVNRLNLLMYFTDWRESDAKRGDADYPQAPVMCLRIQTLELDRVAAYFAERAALHAKAATLPDEHLPLCSSKERWERGAKWAVHSVGKDGLSKTATRGGLYDKDWPDARERAEEFVKETTAKTGKEYTIVDRPGICARCQPRWCHGCKWCTFYQDLQKASF